MLLSSAVINGCHGWAVHRGVTDAGPWIAIGWIRTFLLSRKQIGAGFPFFFSISTLVVGRVVPNLMNMNCKCHGIPGFDIAGSAPISFFFVVVSQLKFSSVGVGDK
jgi:hypothetical protein